MSFAYKLWKIGNVLQEEEIKSSITDSSATTEKNYSYVNIDVKVNNNEVLDFNVSENAIEPSKLFFTKKIGGTSNAYYLYPNLNLQLKKTNKLSDKLKTLINTLSNSVIKFADQSQANLIENIIEKLKNQKSDTIIKLKEELDNCVKDSGVYWFWLSINGKTFYELMPEVWTNWYKNPVLPNSKTKIVKGFDIFSNKETYVGYSPNIAVFSYDNYHNSLNYRINENLPLSIESAKNIKFAWMYILDNLVFYYKGLQYVILPNLLNNDKELYKIVINRLQKARNMSREKKSILQNLTAQEKNLKKDIAKKKEAKLKEELEKIKKEIEATDVGVIEEFHNQAEKLEAEDLKNSITLDYIFTSINRTNLSFELKGSIEDVIPSRLRKVVEKMKKKEHPVSDLVTLKKRDKNKAYLQDFFNRDELYFVLNKSAQKNSNSILKEKLYLAKLLITDRKIKLDNLLERFENHREYGYDRKKRVNKEGIREWIQYSASFSKNEKRVIDFLNSLNKIEE